MAAGLLCSVVAFSVLALLVLEGNAHFPQVILGLGVHPFALVRRLRLFHIVALGEGLAQVEHPHLIDEGEDAA